MNPAVQQVIAWGLSFAVFFGGASLTVACAVLSYQAVQRGREFRRFVTTFIQLAEVITVNQALTVKEQEALAKGLHTALKGLPEQTAAMLFKRVADKSLIGLTEKMNEESVPTAPPAKPPSSPGLDLPTPPPLPGKPLLILAATLLSLGLTAFAHTPGDIPVSLESGKEALRRSNYVKAEVMFARDGDELGQAEALIDQKRLDEAKLICERHPTDGKAKLFLALIACKAGERENAERLLGEAKAMGNRPAERLLAVGNWWEVVTCARGSV